MDGKKIWPKVGDKLVHQSRKKPGEIVAEVVAVNKVLGTISLRVGTREYSSLSAAAKAIAGGSQNGWVFWGLKR